MAGLGSLLGELSGTALKTYPFPADCEPELDGKCVGLVRVCEPGAPCGLECQAKTPPRVSKACKSKHPCAEDAERLCEFVGSRSEIFDCLVAKRGNVTDACRASEPCLQSLTHNKCDHQPGKSHGKGGGRGGAGASKPGGKQPLNFGSFMRDIFGMDDSEEGEDEGQDFTPRAIHRSKHASKRAHDLENREASVAEREKLLDRSRAEVQREREELDREFKFAHQMTNPHSALNTMEKLKYHDAGDSALPADDESSGARTSGPRSALAAVFLTFLAGSMGIVLACPAGAE